MDSSGGGCECASIDLNRYVLVIPKGYCFMGQTLKVRGPNPLFGRIWHRRYCLFRKTLALSIFMCICIEPLAAVYSCHRYSSAVALVSFASFVSDLTYIHIYIYRFVCLFVSLKVRRGPSSSFSYTKNFEKGTLWEPIVG